MKTRTKIIWGLGILFSLRGSGVCGSVTNFSNTVSYTAPTNFFMIDYKEDQSTPFSIGGSPIEYDHDPNSSISFELSYACFSVGKGKAYQFQSATLSDLKHDFESFYRQYFTNMPPAIIGKTAGLASVSSSAVVPPSELGTCYFYSSWVQIETNIVVKVKASSCDANIFKELTNSLQTLKIDKNGILKQVAGQMPLRPQY